MNTFWNDNATTTRKIKQQLNHQWQQTIVKLVVMCFVIYGFVLHFLNWATSCWNIVVFLSELPLSSFSLFSFFEPSFVRFLLILSRLSSFVSRFIGTKLPRRTSPESTLCPHAFKIDNNKFQKETEPRNQYRYGQCSYTYAYVDNCTVRTIILFIWNCAFHCSSSFSCPLGSPIWRCFQVFRILYSVH